MNICFVRKEYIFFILNMILLIVDPFNDSGLSPTKKASDFFYCEICITALLKFTEILDFYLLPKTNIKT